MRAINKLKKSPPSPNSSTLKPNYSNTLSMAMNDISSPPSTQAVQRLATTVQPLTAAEQYWATRALKAEALLAAQETHKKEIRNLGHENDMKREVCCNASWCFVQRLKLVQWELKLLAKEHKEKHAALEKLLVRILHNKNQYNCQTHVYGNRSFC